MADIIFFIAGVVMLFKKSVRISSKRTLSGKPVKILAILYILPAAIGFFWGLLSAIGRVPADSSINTAFWLEIPIVCLAFAATIYFIFLYKSDVQPQLTESKNTSGI